MEKKHILRCLIALFLILMWYMFEFTKLLNIIRIRFTAKISFKIPKQGRHTDKGSPPIIVCLSSFFSLLFSFFSLYHTVNDKHHWNLVSRRSICVGILSLPEFIINALVYCWRYREIRQIAKNTVKKIICMNENMT